ncbi:MAG: TonB-dependent receptor [Pseudomonadota bacterium]|nr:TonB-dependent receptor [Pseudomonadota bacterium]
MKKLSIILFSTFLIFNTQIFSQDVENSSIEEIVVTSQKRANAIAVQDLPISVTAINEKLIIDSDALDLTDIGRMVPNATLHPSATFAGTPNFLIRGIGVSGTTRSLDPTVGIIVDGVYLGFPVGANLDMFDRESIEILRGPQGTLLGRNVTGGAIVVRTKRPTGEFGAKVDVTVGDYSRRDLSFSVEGPISDKISAKIAVMSRERDGYWKDNNGGSMIPTAGAIARGYDETGQGESGAKPDVDLTIIRPMLLIEPTENLDITFIGEFLSDKSGTANSRNFVNNDALRRTQLFGYTPPEDRYEINHNLMGGNDLEIDTFIGEFNLQTDSGILTGIASYRELTYDSSTDFDGSPITLFHFPNNHEEQEQQTFELRYAGSYSDNVDYVIGVSYFDQEMFVGERRDFGVVDIAGVTELSHDSIGIFAELDYLITDKTKITLGTRWTEESKDVKFNAIGSCEKDFSSCSGPNSGLTRSGTYDDITPKIAITHSLNEDVNIYASFTQGFRSGSFDARARTIDSFLNSQPGPEEVTSIELGLKSTFNDGKVLLNIALFQAEYDDIQKLALEECEVDIGTCSSGTIQRLINAAKATIEGIEIETKISLTDQLSIEGSLGYTDAGFDEFLGFDADGVRGYDPVTDPAAAAALKFERVPELTYNIMANYFQPLANGAELDFRLSYSYTDDFTNNALMTEAIKTDSYGLLDASVSYTFAQSGLKLTVFGKNITDEDYHDFALDNVLTSLTWGGVPDTYGLRLTYSFN